MTLTIKLYNHHNRSTNDHQKWKKSPVMGGSPHLLRGGAGGERRRHIVERANRLGQNREVRAAGVVAGGCERGVDCREGSRCGHMEAVIGVVHAMRWSTLFLHISHCSTVKNGQKN